MSLSKLMCRQLGGYARHRQAFRRGWQGLIDEVSWLSRYFPSLPSLAYFIGHLTTSRSPRSALLPGLPRYTFLPGTFTCSQLAAYSHPQPRQQLTVRSRWTSTASPLATYHETIASFPLTPAMPGILTSTYLSCRIFPVCQYGPSVILHIRRDMAISSCCVLPLLLSASRDRARESNARCNLGRAAVR